jgi:ribosomal-protein-serine acetyltransferase
VFSLSVDDTIELRLLEPRHAAEVFSLVDRDRERLRQWFPWVDSTASVDDEATFIRSALEQFAQGRAIVSGIWERGKIVGTIGLDIHPGNVEAEVGYWLAAEAEGRGIVTSATRALTRAAFDELGLHRIVIRCATHNKRSCAVPERLGFRFEGILRECERIGDRYFDHRLYSALATDEIS